MKLRAEENRMCAIAKKLQYRSPGEAEKRRKSLKRRRGENLHVYRCNCGYWHLGHH
jgi:hypothetical protein